MSKTTEVLRAARKRAGITQTALAKTLRISTAFLNDIEHGRRDLGKKYIQRLPEPIRGEVAEAAIEALREIAERIRNPVAAD